MNRNASFFLFLAVIIIWGTNWTVTKMLVATVPPIWSAAIRSCIAVVALFILQILTGQFVIPKRGDGWVIFVVSFFHMSLFGAFMAIGLQFISVGRSVVLGYTTPLWVAPGAWLFLREPLPPLRIAGVILGLCGLLALFNPLALDWSDSRALIGNGLLLLAALCWAVSILYVRAHKWVSTPFQLVLWQNLLAVVILSATAFVLEGVPHFTLTPAVMAQFAYSGILATAFGFWAVTVINSILPATLTSLGLLATPVVGILSSLIMLGESPDMSLMLAGGMILGGIAVGSVPQQKDRRRNASR